MTAASNQPRRGRSLPQVRAVYALRWDLERLGLGPFGSWRQLTSGAHGILLFTRLCERVSVYGFTSYSNKGPDQYNGRLKKVHSGKVFHDWDMESAMVRGHHTLLPAPSSLPRSYVVPV